jgi:predicted RecA/RadA family phage recombinase
MAKNYVQDGEVLTLVAPAGGVNSGVPVAIGQLVVVPIVDAAAGALFGGRTGGVWKVPVADGLAAGAAVGILDGDIVASATASAIACGKLVTAEADGYADWMLIN